MSYVWMFLDPCSRVSVCFSSGSVVSGRVFLVDLILARSWSRFTISVWTYFYESVRTFSSLIPGTELNNPWLMVESQVYFTRLKTWHEGNGLILPLYSVGVLIWKNVLILKVVVSTTSFSNNANLYILLGRFCNYYLLIGEQNFTSCIKNWWYSNEWIAL